MSKSNGWTKGLSREFTPCESLFCGYIYIYIARFSLCTMLQFPVLVIAQRADTACHLEVV